MYDINDEKLSAARLQYPITSGDTFSVAASPTPAPAAHASDQVSNSPHLLHSWDNLDSIISIIAAPSKNLLFCGTQNSNILIFDLITYSLVSTINGENISPVSILGLTIDKDENYLFSTGSDSLVKIWDITDVSDIYCIKIIYSAIDIGDIFSICYCDEAKTLYLGAQNASILWCEIDLTCIKEDFEAKKAQTEAESTNDKSNLPHFRYNKFFDSKGPGGRINNLQLNYQLMNAEFTVSLCNIDNNNLVTFAHNSYIYGLQITNNEFLKLRFPKYSQFLFSCGGDGLVNLWGVDSSTSKIEKLKSLECDESILSMHLDQIYLYVGLSDGTIDVWDLLTFQLIKSIKSSCGEPISALVAINNSIFIGSKLGLTLNAGKKVDSLSTESVIALHLFVYNGMDLLVSGGKNSIGLFTLSNLDEHANGSRPKSNNKLKTDDSSLKMMLSKFISFRTVAKSPGLYLDDSRNCTRFLIKLLNGLGAFKTSLIPIAHGNPIVISEFKNSKKSPTAKRILWYAHYDVVDAIQTHDNWSTNPFEMVSKNGFLYGRGVSDNKGPTLGAIYAVAELFSKDELACDVVFIIEGEEECGSIDFQTKVTENKQLIGDIDWILLSNSYWLDDDRPCLNYGLRGVINCSIEIESDKPDRHSGVHGGVAKEPTMDLIHLLNKLVDEETNFIKIPKFYDSINEISAVEMNFFKKIVDYNPKLKLNELVARWTKPSLTVHKIEVSGPNNDTVIPKASKSSVSLRIVPSQDIDEVKRSFVKYLHSEFMKLNTPNHINIKIFHEAEPWIGDFDNVAYKVVYEKIKKNWGMEPLFIREGGSIPGIRFLEKTFEAPACQIPCGQASDNAHLPDERLRLLNLLKLKDILADTLRELGTLGPAN